MKYLSPTILFLVALFLAPFAADAATVTKTICASGCDYTTITLWEADLDDTGIYASGDIAQGLVSAAETFTESPTINGGTTVGLASTTLTVAEAYQHDGTAGTGAKVSGRIIMGTGSGDTVERNVHWLEVQSGSFGDNLVYINGTGQNIMSHLLAHDSTTTSGLNRWGALRGLESATGSSNYVIFHNNILYDINQTGGGSRVANGIQPASGSRYSRMFNNTVHNVNSNGTGVTYGINGPETNDTARNNVVTDTSNSAGGSVKDFSSSSGTANNNASSDTSAPGANSLTNISAAQQYVSTADGSEDFHLKNGADLIDAGADLTGATPDITSDIDNVARSGTWDIGVDEFTGTASSRGLVELVGGTVTASNFTSPTIYVDGAVSSTFPDTDNWHHIVVTDSAGVSAADVHLGLVETAYYEGLLDDFRLYDRVLSAADVSRLYELGATTHFNTTVTSNPALENGLIGHWTFDGDQMDPNVRDRSGDDNHAFLFNFTSTTTALGVIGQALEFDGVNDYLDFINTGANMIFSGEFTFAWWFKKPDNSTVGIVIGEDSGTSGGTPKVGSTNGNFFIRIISDSDSTVALPSEGEWHHAVLTRDSADKVDLYVDGGSANRLFSDAAQSGTYTADTIGANGDGTQIFGGILDDVRMYERALSTNEVKRLYELGATTHINTTIGTGDDGGSTLANGLIGHWTFDGKDMYQNVADRSGQGNHGYLSGQTSTTTAIGKIGQALEFDGSDDYIDVGNDASLQLSQAVTIAAWLDLGGTGNKVIAGKWENAEADRSYGLITVSGVPRFILNFSNASVSLDATTNLTDAGWHHVAATYAGSGMRIYIDGVQENSNAQTGSFDTENAITAKIGWRAGSTEYMTGPMDDVRIYDRALSADEVKRLYDLGR